MNQPENDRKVSFINVLRTGPDEIIVLCGYIKLYEVIIKPSLNANLAAAVQSENTYAISATADDPNPFFINAIVLCDETIGRGFTIVGVQHTIVNSRSNYRLIAGWKSETQVESKYSEFLMNYTDTSSYPILINHKLSPKRIDDRLNVGNLNTASNNHFKNLFFVANDKTVGFEIRLFRQDVTVVNAN